MSFLKHKWKTDTEKSTRHLNTYQVCEKTGDRRVLVNHSGYQPVDTKWLKAAKSGGYHIR